MYILGLPLNFGQKGVWITILIHVWKMEIHFKKKVNVEWVFTLYIHVLFESFKVILRGFEEYVSSTSIVKYGIWFFFLFCLKAHFYEFPLAHYLYFPPPKYNKPPL